jgi:serine/threonine protein phosphatase PrpC
VAWSLGGASVRGASHVRRGQPNQDAVAWTTPAVADATRAVDRFVAAVSDGHGGAAYFRSGTGARMAVDAANAILNRVLDMSDLPESPEPLIAEILTTWRQAVMQHLADDPIDSDWIEAEQDKLLPYGTTLSAVAVGPDRLIAIQIGDGDMLFVYPDERVERPLANDEGLFGEQTYSMCLDDAAQRFRVRALRREAGQPWPDFIMLSTDGVSKSFADEKTFQSIARDYRSSVRKMGLRSVLDQLEKWLGDVSQRGSGDDVTLCLAIGMPSPGAPAPVRADERAPETSI